MALEDVGETPIMTTNRHLATMELLSYFTYCHLPEYLRAVSRECAVLAHSLVDQLPDGPELTAGLRKLLEAKDCFVRQAVRMRRAGGVEMKRCDPVSCPPFTDVSLNVTGSAPIDHRVIDGISADQHADSYDDCPVCSPNRTQVK